MASILAKMAVEISANTAQFNKSIAETNRKLDSFSKGVTGIGKTLVAGFGLYEIGRGIIDVTSQFQKFEAVLTNTLGDSSAAQKALRDIEAFAASTPFQVDEVTAAYVRWANQGLDPTIDRMGKLGDIASSLGAGFEQTAEAFKDLMVGQTKRIEEIGISATQSNGKIQLSFKGVNIEVEKNKEGVQKALDVYSQLNGVLGTSDAVSKTLGGRISNLKDSWDQLLKTLGEGNSGALFTTVTLMTRLIQGLNYAGVQGRIFTQGIKGLSDIDFEKLMNFGETESLKKISDVLKDITSQSNSDFFKNISGNMKEFVSLLVKEGETQEDALDIWNRYVDVRVKSTQLDRDKSKNESIKAVQDEIKAAKERFDLIQKEKQLQIEKDLALRIKLYEDLTKASDQYNQSIKAGIEDKIASGSGNWAIDKGSISALGGFKDFNPDGIGGDMSNVSSQIAELLPAIEEYDMGIQGLTDSLIANQDASLNSAKAWGAFGQAAGSILEDIIAKDSEWGKSSKQNAINVIKTIKGLVYAYVAMAAAAAMAKGDPYTAVVRAGAIATVGLSIVSGLLKRSMNEETGGGPSVSRPSTRAYGNMQNSIQVSGVIRGQDIYLSNKNYQRNNRSTSFIGG